MRSFAEYFASQGAQGHAGRDDAKSFLHLTERSEAARFERHNSLGDEVHL
jgi:hypothetical protein